MSESQLQQMVIDLARWAGFLAYHTFDSRKSQPGFPDLVLVHKRTGRLLFVELKSDKGAVRADQYVWLEALGRRHEAYLWRPAHWSSGAIRRALTGQELVA